MNYTHGTPACFDRWLETAYISASDGSTSRGFPRKWIQLRHISVSKVRETKWGLGGRIKGGRGPRAECCCSSDKFTEEADSHLNLADAEPLLLAEDKPVLWDDSWNLQQGDALALSCCSRGWPEPPWTGSRSLTRFILLPDGKHIKELWFVAL